LARSYDKKGLLSPQVVTLWYRAPELLLGCSKYACSCANYGAVDIWSAGATFGEMMTQKPIFGGNCEIGQIHTIFSALGTPTEARWPGVSKLPNFSLKFPQWPQRTAAQYLAFTKSPKAVARKTALTSAALAVCDDGLDLLEKLLAYAPNKRMSAEQALAHQYFCSHEEARGRQ
jgi:serine/threonine protein kinase